MAQFKRFSSSNNTNNYDSNQVFEEGTLTWDAGNGLRLHDGYTDGGNPVGGGSQINIGSSGISDVMGGSSSADNGKFLQQYATAQSAWSFVDKIDTADAPINLEPTGTHDFNNVSGMVVVTDQYDGFTYAFICGCGAVVKLGGTNSVVNQTPADTCTITAAGGAYRLTNTSGTNRNFGVAWVVTRHSN